MHARVMVVYDLAEVVRDWVDSIAVVAARCLYNDIRFKSVRGRVGFDWRDFQKLPLLNGALCGDRFNRMTDV